MDSILALITQPEAWIALITLILMEIVLGIDNLIFISILSNKLPVSQRQKARRIGLSLALLLRLALLATITWIVALTEPFITLFGKGFSWRDIILIAGGLFLVWKATTEIHHNVDPDPDDDLFDSKPKTLNFSAAVGQIIMLDLVFSIDSIITAVGMTHHLPIMFAAVIFAIAVMMVAATPLSEFIGRHPTIVMLALSFLFMIGMSLIADGFSFHVPKGYIYAAMGFSVCVEGLNLVARKNRQKRQAAKTRKK